MRKSLSTKLEQKRVGLSYCTSGIYMPNYSDFIITPKTPLSKKHQSGEEQPVDLLDAGELSKAINDKLFNEETAVSLQEFVSKHEWDAYRDFEESW